MATVSTTELLKSQTEASHTFIGWKRLCEGLGITKLTGRKKGEEKKDKVMEIKRLFHLIKSDQTKAVATP